MDDHPVRDVPYAHVGRVWQGLCGVSSPSSAGLGVNRAGDDQGWDTAAHPNALRRRTRRYVPSFTSSCSNGNCGALISTESGHPGKAFFRPADSAGDPYGAHSWRMKLCVMPSACSGTAATSAAAPRFSRNIRGLPFASSVIARGTSAAFGRFPTIIFTIVPPSRTTFTALAPFDGTTLRTSGWASKRRTTCVNSAARLGYRRPHAGCARQPLKLAAIPSCALFHVQGRVTMSGGTTESIVTVRTPLG